MKDIICVDDNFLPQQKEFFLVNNVITPIKDIIYTIREVVPLSINTKSIGFLLNEIQNPKVLIKHPILGIIKVEPNWSSKRFTDLQGNELTQDMLQELLELQSPKITLFNIETN